MLAQVVQQVY